GMCPGAAGAVKGRPGRRQGYVNRRCFTPCSQKATDISDRIVLKFKAAASPGNSDVKLRTEHVMRSTFTGLAGAAALAGVVVLASGTEASAYRGHRYRAPVVGIAAGSL